MEQLLQHIDRYAAGVRHDQRCGISFCSVRGGARIPTFSTILVRVG